ncbi:MAG TPA: NarK family nitrate/nitrite MFS transporter [Steroidobacteraceae bacterium]|nr:NarK family nitrate/nitrite MFS transporter [Steroidobacteraceae bacterium]
MSGKATRLNLLSLSNVQMRVFHLTWMAFFVCFFAWFAVAPLMPVIRDDLHLTKDQIANINIAAVLVTILVRLVIGPLCDKFGARRTYTWLLALGAVPVIGIGFSQSYETFLFFRLCIGAIGASFVITQYHTSVMFAPNVVGTANATAAGWGNAGGGATQAMMPLIMSLLISLGVEKALSWRAALFVPGVMMLVMAVVYYLHADDTPEGKTTAATKVDANKPSGWQSFLAAARDYRVWLLFVTYAACFGVELTIHNLAAVYYVDRFGLDLKTAGLYVGAFGLLALFARALGGLISDRIAHSRGLDGRTLLLFVLILAEGLGLMSFAKMDTAVAALGAMLVFGLFVHMACGATYALVPFINRKALGGVAGIIGAGGNVGAVAAGFLMKGVSTTQQGLFALGAVVTISALCAIAVRFSREHKAAEQKLYEEAIAAREQLQAVPVPVRMR